MDNLDKPSQDNLLGIIENDRDFSKGLNRQTYLTPVNPDQPVRIEIVIGDGTYSRTLTLPPLNVPETDSGNSGYPPFGVCAGFSCSSCSPGGNNFDEKTLCFSPKHAHGKFAPGPNDANIDQQIHLGGIAEIKSRTPDKICVHVATSNTSGCINTSTVTVSLSAKEIYPKSEQKH